MSTPAPPPFSDSDRAWFDGLGAHDGAAAADEAATLRAVLGAVDADLDADPAFAAAATPEAQARSWQRLQASLVAAGAFVPPVPAPQPARRGHGFAQALRRPWVPALLLALAVLAAGGWWLGRPPLLPAPPPLMGVVPNLVVQDDNDPRASAVRLADGLRALGLKPGLYQRGSTFVVDIDLEPEAVAAAAPVLGRLGIAARPGFTRVELKPR